MRKEWITDRKEMESLLQEALVGCLAGIAFGAAVVYAMEGSFRISVLATPLLFVAVILAAPILSAVASLVPAMTAARHDPAVVLREE